MLHACSSCTVVNSIPLCRCCSLWSCICCSHMCGVTSGCGQQLPTKPWQSWCTHVSCCCWLWCQFRLLQYTQQCWRLSAWFVLFAWWGCRNAKHKSTVLGMKLYLAFKSNKCEGRYLSWVIDEIIFNLTQFCKVPIAATLLTASTHGNQATLCIWGTSHVQTIDGWSSWLISEVTRVDTSYK